MILFIRILSEFETYLDETTRTLYLFFQLEAAVVYLLSSLKVSSS